MAKLVGRRPIEIKISEQIDGYFPVFDIYSRSWNTISRNSILSGSAILNGNNLFTGSQFISGSLNVNGPVSITGSFNVIQAGITGSLLGTASYSSQALTASNANTASYADNFTVAGTLTAQTIVAQTITSSTEFITGSTQFGSLLSNTHQFTGSVSVTGSLEVNGRNYINDSSSFADRITTDSSSFESRITTNSSSFADFSGSYVNESSSFASRITTNSASFSSFSGSYVNESSSFESRITTNSSSFTNFSGSYVNESSSFAGRITTNSSSFATFSGSHVIESASFDNRINNISSSFAALSGSFNTGSFTGSFVGSLTGIASNAISSSYAATASSADNLTVRGTLTAQTIVAQTITSSTEFITGSTRNGSLLSNTHQFTGSVLVTGSLSVNGSDYTTTSGSASTRLTALEVFSGSYSTGSFTGSFIGRVTGSFSGSLYNLQNTVLGHIPFFSSSQVLADSIARQLDNGSGSYSIVINQDNITTAAPEALYVYQPSATSYNVIAGKGNLNSYLQLNIQNTNTGENASSDVIATANNGNESVNYIDMGINSEGFTGSVGGPNDAYLYSTGNELHIGNASNYPIQFFAGGIDNNANKKFQLNPNNLHQMTGSLDISGSIIAKSFTGSLQGTSSWASNAINTTSASYATTASLAINANNAANAVNATTASYVLNAQSASYWSGSIIHAATASYVQNAQTASYVLQAVSASYATNALTASNANTASYVLQAVSASFATTASYALFVDGISNGTASIAATASFVQNAQTASYVENAQTASFVLNAVSASYATSASFVVGLSNGTASLAATASYAATASSADDFTVRGTLTAQTIVAQTITSSVEYITGSTQFGSLLTNTHQFTGSVLVTGSLSVNGSNVILTNQTSSMSVLSASNATTASYALHTGKEAIVTSPGGIYYIDGVAKPVLTFTPGKTYRFNTSTVDSPHPFKFSLSPNGPTQYTYGVTSGSGYIEINVDYNTSSSLYYYCTIHSGMGNAANTLRSEDIVFNSQTSSMSVASASFASTADLLDGKDSTTFATTGSNIFVGNQIITGSFTVSGSTTQIGNNILSGSITVTGSVNAKSDINLGGVLRLDPATDPGAANTTSSFLFTSASNTATGYDLYYRQGSNKVKFKWFEGVLNTGILYGGVLTYSSSYFYVSSGSGIIVNHNATTGSEVSPVINYVNWAASSHSIANTGSQNTYVFIDANGDIQQQTSFFTPEQYHDLLPIGRVSHYGSTGSLVTGVGNNMLTAYDVPQQLGQFTRAFGPLKISGFTITPQVGNLHLNIGSGTAFNLGGYYQNSPDIPSTYNSNTYLTSSIIRLYRSGSGFIFDNNGGSYYTSVNPTLYDDGDGTLASVGNSNWSIQRVFVNPVTGRSHVYYGQSTYPTYLNAISSLSSDNFIESEVTKNAYVFAGYLVMNGNSSNTDLSVGDPTNAIIQAGLFRNSVGGSGGATTAVSELNDLSDVNISSPSNGQALIYSSGTWINGTPISSSYAQTASFIAGLSNGTASYANTASFALTASYLLGQSPTSSYALTASYVENAQTASYVLNAQSASFALTASHLLGQSPTASYALTASYADNFTVAGTLTAQTIVAQTITSSIEFITGSTRNGSLLLNTHQFTGSVLVTGSLSVNGSNVVLSNQTSSMSVATASFVTLAQTASYVESAQTASYVTQAQSASYWSGSIINATSASYANNATSASYSLTASYAANVPETASYALVANSSSYALTASYAANVPLTASYALVANSSSFATSALTASYTPNAIVTASVNISTITFTKGDNSTFNITVAQSGSVESSSFAINATSASHALNANTASFAINATSASHALNANTASFALNVNSASFAQTSSYSSYAAYAGNSPGATATMTQSVAATTWSFTHNLNTRTPLLQVYDSTNSQIIPYAVIGSDPLVATIYFDTAESGYAVASNGGTLTVSGSTARLDQTSAAVTWSFTHNLATKYPNFEIWDSNDNIVIPAGIHAVSDMAAEIYFAFPTTGIAIANFSGIAGSPNATTASYAVTATTASYAYNFNVANQLTIDQTLTDYHTVPSSIVGSNNMFTRVTGSYSSAFFKYSVTKGSNSRAGEVMAAWAGGTLQYTDNSTLDIGDTSGVVASSIISSNSVQFNINTADSGWTLKTLATFM